MLMLQNETSARFPTTYYILWSLQIPSPHLLHIQGHIPGTKCVLAI